MGITMQKRLSKVEEIRTEKEGDKKREIVVLHKTLPQKEKRSVWSWFEEFAMEWSETLITKRKKNNPTS
jgi:hypothetical protein